MPELAPGLIAALATELAPGFTCEYTAGYTAGLFDEFFEWCMPRTAALDTFASAFATLDV